MSADITAIFEVWKDILSVRNILVQTRFTVLRVTSVSILCFKVRRLMVVRVHASVSGSVFSVLCGAPAELSISIYTVPDTPLAGLPAVSTLLRTDVPTHTLTHLTHYSPLRRTTFTAIHQFQPPWRCDICVDLRSVPLYLSDLCRTV